MVLTLLFYSFKFFFLLEWTSSKEEDQTLFFSRDVGFHFNEFKEQLEKVNMLRKGKFDYNKEAAKFKRGNANKQDLTESPFSKKFIIEFQKMVTGHMKIWCYIWKIALLC